ncbi:MAG: ATPase [Spirochaetales bacterium]|nr:ATPase [Spirochaetales bacterium]MCF7939896.1 ATPase [Spirochaetales bacterium]
MEKNGNSTETISQLLENGGAIFGFELGSTRIKATLIGPDYSPLVSGSYGWENKFENGVWTYDIDDVLKGVEACFSSLISEVEKVYGVRLSKASAGGFSAMMHGYIALDENDRLLVPFRTWRNNITGEASAELTELFAYPIPQRWSIAHLYQAILNNEEHVPKIARLTTLAGYVHMKLTGRHVIGIDDASGMFPIDPKTKDYDEKMLAAFDNQVKDHNFPWKLKELLPVIVPAGEEAGTITEEGARILDSRGRFEAGTPLCPPEGDAGTGMIATNSIKPRTGNVSAGTSVFAMLVLEKKLSKVHPEIDLVVTPDGSVVAMAHSNNCTSDFDAWVSLFVQAAEKMGKEVTQDEAFAALIPLALQGDADAGGLLSYGYISGEHLTGFSEGRPLFVRKPDSSFTIENFVRSHLFSALCAMRSGLDILIEEEGVQVEELRGHGGFFKAEDIGQRIMAAAAGTPVRVLDTAGEGGAWGMALLAAFTARGNKKTSLPEFLEQVFAGSMGTARKPDPEDRKGFNTYYSRYKTGLPVERAAVDTLL